MQCNKQKIILQIHIYWSDIKCDVHLLWVSDIVLSLTVSGKPPVCVCMCVWGWGGAERDMQN